MVLIVLFIVLFLYCLKKIYITSLIGLSLNSFFLKALLSFFLFVFLLNFWLLYRLLERGPLFLVSSSTMQPQIFESMVSTDSFALSYVSTSLLEVYYFPFIYIFIFITFLSIFFCLSYNFSEFNLFMLYCIIILLAGSVLFFTDSLVIFFFSYELLLVPSFFILYKFAKTRRCVEAAYLMFF